MKNTPSIPLSTQVICEENKIIIETPLEKFKMNYSDIVSLEMFFSLFLGNAQQMTLVAKTKLKHQLKQFYGNTIMLFIVDGSKVGTIELQNNDKSFQENLNKLTKTFSSIDGKLTYNK